MILSHIAAAAENNVIGAGNKLPWDIPEDMKFFRDKTKGRAVIMGRKTYESMGKPLPNRLNVIITRQPAYQAPGAVVVPSIDDALEYCRGKVKEYGDEVFIIGGGEIYRQSMDLIDIIYLTRVHKAVPGDATYPQVDPRQFEEIERRERPGDPAYTFLTYRRKEPVRTSQ